MTHAVFMPRFEVSINTSIIGKDPSAIRSGGWLKKSKTAPELLLELSKKGHAIVPAALKGRKEAKMNSISHQL